MGVDYAGVVFFGRPLSYSRIQRQLWKGWDGNALWMTAAGGNRITVADFASERRENYEFDVLEMWASKLKEQDPNALELDWQYVSSMGSDYDPLVGFSLGRSPSYGRKDIGTARTFRQSLALAEQSFERLFRTGGRVWVLSWQH